MNAAPIATKPKLVLIGNGMAGARCLEELLKLAPDKYDISVIGEERFGNYNRIMLSPVLAGEKTIESIMLNDVDWYHDHKITLYKGEKAVKINRKQRVVCTESGLEIPYTRLILATGSIPRRLAVPGKELSNIFTFRDINDVNNMLALCHQRKHVAVIGGGLLGLEAANGLSIQGMEVTVIHSSEYLLNRQLDEEAARLLERSLASKGIGFYFNARTKALIGDSNGAVTQLQFEDGRTLDADMVIMATGITPNIELAQSAGLQCQTGILVSDAMQTFDPAIYAIGECVQHRGELFGLVAPLFEQAKVCANHLAELGYGIYVSKALATQLKITGIHAFSAGNFLGTHESEVITYHDEYHGYYKKLVIAHNKLIGAILYGDTQDGGWFFDLIQAETDISDWRDQLIFGKDFCNQAA